MKSSTVNENQLLVRSFGTNTQTSCNVYIWIYILYLLLAATHLETSSGTLGDSIREKISHGRVVVPSPKIVINLHRTYEKLRCKG